MPLYILSIFCFVFVLFAVFSQAFLPTGGLQEGELTLEAKNFYISCAEGDLGNEHDCGCLSSQYMEIRSASGPMVKKEEIEAVLNPSFCPQTETSVAANAATLSAIAPAAGEATTMQISLSAPTAPTPIENDFSALSDVDIEEAQGVYEECTRDGQMSTYYDCECLSIQYLDVRTEKGLSVSRSEIIRSLNTECPNTIGVAGQTYSQCLETGQLRTNGMPLEDFCSCVGNTVAKLYEAGSVAPGTNAFYALTTKAMIACDPV